MFKGLDSIPWADLEHAYGSAADVPELLRAMQTASPDLEREESPLWNLYGNIWHQGTVYQATAYAVPFLIELAVDRRTPDRVGILSLLAEIAKGSSFRQVHGNILNEPDFERKRAEELSWVQQAHKAVAAGFKQFVEFTKEPGDVRFAAVNVIAQLPRHGVAGARIIRKLLSDEERIYYRAGLLLLIGRTGDISSQSLAVLDEAFQSSEVMERNAAAFAIAKLKVRPLPAPAREAVMDTILTQDLELNLQDLPWDAASGLDANQLYDSLEPAYQDQVVTNMVASLEAGKLDSSGAETLVSLLFPLAKIGETVMVTASGMSPIQLRAVRALYKAMKGGKRIIHGHFPCWGLPDTMREWRALADGQDPPPVDESLPLLANARYPQKDVVPGKLKIGQKVIHREFGSGKVVKVKAKRSRTDVVIHFDEEGVKELSLSNDSSS